MQSTHGVILRAGGLGHTLSFGTAAAAAVDEVAAAAAEVLVLLAAAAAVGSAGQRSLGSGRL